jgi:hypothetical protein
MMKKFYTTLALVLAFTAGVAFAQAPNWHDLDAIHVRLTALIQDMEHTRQGNRFDITGHAARAEQLLKDADNEMHQAVLSAQETNR